MPDNSPCICPVVWSFMPGPVTITPGCPVHGEAADKASHCEACGIVHTALSPCSPPDQRAHGRGAEKARAALAAALGKPAGPYTEQETTK